ncbi:odorant receptor 30a-like isoform X2 [Microplitis mediator]|uniref:odorant receptor 30a-like isoform X2 n=1 Tax=Microplitis mediator TaxID=375433 RepID=UPI002554AD9F|nr:odorant receptor 30a-like isoform X2 [Microplitis mediator]
MVFTVNKRLSVEGHWSLKVVKPIFLNFNPRIGSSFCERIHRNMVDMMRGFFFVAAGLIDLYVITLPADDLHDLSTKISLGIYESNWIGSSLSVQKSLIIMMCRAQKPLVINVEGILPALTCQFYAASISFIVSFLMTLRALVFEK